MPIEPKKPIGKTPNAQHQTFHGFMTGAPYQLAIVEFDDQGRCSDRGPRTRRYPGCGLE